MFLVDGSGILASWLISVDSHFCALLNCAIINIIAAIS